MEFKVGDKIKVVDWDRMYHTYDSYASETSLTRFVNGDARPFREKWKDTIVTVVGEYNGRIGVELIDGSGRQYVIGRDGVAPYETPHKFPYEVGGFLEASPLGDARYLYQIRGKNEDGTFKVGMGAHSFKDAREMKGFCVAGDIKSMNDWVIAYFPPYTADEEALIMGGVDLATLRAQLTTSESNTTTLDQKYTYSFWHGVSSTDTHHKRSTLRERLAAIRARRNK